MKQTGRQRGKSGEIERKKEKIDWKRDKETESARERERERERERK